MSVAVLLSTVTEKEINLAWEGPLEITWSNAQLKTGLSLEVLRLLSGRFGMSPRMEILQPLWTNLSQYHLL